MKGLLLKCHKNKHLLVSGRDKSGHVTSENGSCVWKRQHPTTRFYKNYNFGTSPHSFKTLPNRNFTKFFKIALLLGEHETVMQIFYLLCWPEFTTRSKNVPFEFTEAETVLVLGKIITLYLQDQTATVFLICSKFGSGLYLCPKVAVLLLRELGMIMCVRLAITQLSPALMRIDTEVGRAGCPSTAARRDQSVHRKECGCRLAQPLFVWGKPETIINLQLWTQNSIPSSDFFFLFLQWSTFSHTLIQSFNTYRSMWGTFKSLIKY